MFIDMSILFCLFFQEQERKRHRLAYLKQLELKKHHEEKLVLIEKRKAEKHAQREKKIVILLNS